MGGLEVVVNDKTFGHIAKQGFFNSSTKILDCMEISPADLHKIADKSQETMERMGKGLSPLPT